MGEATDQIGVSGSQASKMRTALPIVLVILTSCLNQLRGDVQVTDICCISSTHFAVPVVLYCLNMLLYARNSSCIAKINSRRPSAMYILLVMVEPNL